MSAQPSAGDTAPGVRPRTPGGPRGHLLLGNLPEFLKRPLDFIQEAAGYGDVVQYRVANITWYQCNHPTGIQRILQENQRNYTKGELTARIVRPVIGNGLFVSEGEAWLRQRRLMQPTFHHRHVATFGELMSAATEAMLTRWRRQAESGATMDVGAEMMGLTLEIVTRALFSTPVVADLQAIQQAMTTLLEDLTFRFRVPFYPSPAVPTPRNRRFRAALHALDQTVYAIISERRRQGDSGGDDLLSLLMNVRDEETGVGMSDKQLRDEVLTLFAAGHETSANVLAWAWYALDQHSDVEQRLHAELTTVLGDRPPTVVDLPNLPYTRMVVEETMRLYPPVWITNRQAISVDEVCGFQVPAKAIVAISPYVMHQHPDYWEQPTVFDPERFTPERTAKRPHYAYFPFGGGPRQCIGKGFAMVETQLLLARIAQRYRLRLVPGHRVAAEALATLRPRNGLPMRIETR